MGEDDAKQTLCALVGSERCAEAFEHDQEAGTFSSADPC